MLKVNNTTDYLKGVFPFESSLTDGAKARLTDAAATDHYGEGGYWVMPLGDLFALIEGDTSILMNENGDGKTAFEVYRIKGVEPFIDQLIASLDALTLPATPDEMRWQQGTKKMSFEEATRVFCRDYFGLPNFKEVDDLTVTDLLIAKEAAYNHAVIERNISLSMKGNKK